VLPVFFATQALQSKRNPNAAWINDSWLPGRFPRCSQGRTVNDWAYERLKDVVKDKTSNGPAALVDGFQLAVPLVITPASRPDGRPGTALP